jgi:SMI1-KNR4 cell-wall
MFKFVAYTLDKMYDDKKKLRTNTVLYGYLEEGRWHTHLQPPLSNEDITNFEEKFEREFPSQYKEFLTYYNGCYLFDILRIAGKDADTYKGLSIEEEGHLAFDLETMDNLYRLKRPTTSQFIFA